MLPRLRVILPYALPGALALICWWFLCRKKDQPDKKQKRAVSVTGLHTDSDFRELATTGASSSGDLSVEFPDGTDQELDSLIQTHLLPVEAVNASSSENFRSHSEFLEHSAEIIDSAIPISDIVMPVESQTTYVQPSNESYNFRPTETSAEDEDFSNISSSHLRHVSSSGPNVQPCMDRINTVLAQCSTSPAIRNTVSKDLEENELTTNSVTESLEEENQKAFISNYDASAFLPLAGNVTCHLRPTETSTEVEALKNILSAELHVKPSTVPSLEPCMDEIETVVKMSLLVQCPQAVANETEVSAREDPCTSETSESNQEKQSTTSKPSEDEGLEFKSNICEITSKVLPSDDLARSCGTDCTDVLKEGKCTDILDAFSQCLGKSEQFENTSSVVDGLEEEKNPNAYFGNYEAKIVEQLAINIISKVIVAAKQEILASSSDMIANCQVLDEVSGKGIQKDSVCEQFALHTSDTDSSMASVVITETDSTCESTQTEQSKLEDISSVEVTDASCLEQHSDKTEDVINKSEPMRSLTTNFNQMHRLADVFEESQVAMEDSSVSVCTSEDGISMDDPLQSTGLSNICVGSYDSWISSGIELSGDTVFSERLKADEAVKNVSEDGDQPDTTNSKSEGSCTGDGEAYHSGGSDVNSMGSVDSGCALGKNKREGRRDSFVVWEFEVPKHLVGRLIGKRGRFVNFLKESSGAKIYISTLPYTEDYQVCHIEGSSPQIERALCLIGLKFKELDVTNIYAPPPPVSFQSLLMTSWLMLPDGVTVEVIVVNVVNAGHMFVQQHTHPTFHALRSLDESMSVCYSEPEIPSLPTPVKVGVICAAPIGDNAWRRAQVVAYYSGSQEVEIRYVDYGGYEKVKIDKLRQIRSDFVPLPFQGAEVLLDNVIPLTGEDYFSSEADDATKEMTRGKALLAQVTNYDGATGLPLVHIWSMMGDEVLSINRTLAEKGFAQWIDGY